MDINKVRETTKEIYNTKPYDLSAKETLILIPMISLKWIIEEYYIHVYLEFVISGVVFGNVNCSKAISIEDRYIYIQEFTRRTCYRSF